MRRSNPALLVDLWIASRSLSSGAHSRDPLARNDEADVVDLKQSHPVLATLARSSPPVQNKILTGPVKHGALSKVNCSAKSPSAEMRGGFLR
jgi:hypothetical protein